MPLKVNLPKSESYSVALAEKLTTEFFLNNTVISGSQIVRFCKIDQVNFFVLKVLMDKWKEETTKLRSPYFDYENEEVKQGVESFLNVLSNHISIKKEFFRPLLQKAIYESIIYIISPKDYLKSEIVQFSNNTEILKRNLKFYKVHRRFAESIINKLKSEVSEREFDEVASLYSEESDYFDVIQPILSQFSTLLVINPKEFVHVDEVPSEPVSVKVPENKVGPVELPVSSPQPKSLIAEPKENLSKENKTLNQSFTKTQLTLNDMLKQQNESMSGKQVKSKIYDIKSAIPLNQKYIFVSELFAGHNSEYEAALAELNECATHEEAMAVLMNKYLPRLKWDSGKKTVQDFFEIVGRKFY